MNNKLTHEQMEKLKACKTAEEAKKLAEKENIELTDEELKDVAGGMATLEDVRYGIPYDNKDIELIQCKDFFPPVTELDNIDHADSYGGGIYKDFETIIK